jgi:hypothetical protein
MTSGDELLIATQNRESLRVFQAVRDEKPARYFQPLALDTRAEFYHKDGKKEWVEFYYGSGYLAQSTRTIFVPSTVGRILVHDSRGNQRNIAYDQLAIIAGR